MLADRFGGARVTFWNFGAMGLATVVVLYASLTQSFAGFVAGFILLFVCAGLGNGSAFKMIPAIFRAKALDRIGQGADVDTAENDSRRLSGALIGIAGAVGALRRGGSSTSPSASPS